MCWIIWRTASGQFLLSPSSLGAESAFLVVVCFFAMMMLMLFGTHSLWAASDLQARDYRLVPRPPTNAASEPKQSPISVSTSTANCSFEPALTPRISAYEGDNGRMIYGILHDPSAFGPHSRSSRCLLAGCGCVTTPRLTK